MKVERIDHIHIKTNDLDPTADELEKIMGQKFIVRMDFTEEQGNKFAISQFPNGLEVLQATDPSKGSGPWTAAAAPGVFALSLKIPDIQEGIDEMKGYGYEEVWHGEFGTIVESLFDTREKLGFMVELISFPSDDVTSVDSGGLN